MLVDKKVTEFLAETASDSPAPGGGSVAALSGALSAALGTMVCNLTIGKEKYADVSEELTKIRETMTENMKHLTKLVDDDSNAFNDVMSAFKMPKETDEEKAKRSAAIQEGYKKAISVPLDTATTSIECMRLLETVAEKGNQNAITDAGTGALSAYTGIIAALLNVKINLGSVKDQDYVAEKQKAVKDLETEARIILDKILAIIDKAL